MRELYCGLASLGSCCTVADAIRRFRVSSDPVRGKTLRWSYDTGLMAGKTYQHAFGTDGTVHWSEVGQKGATASASPASAEDSTATYKIERLNDRAYVVSYLSNSGYTLTTVIDEKTGTIVSVASNEKQLSTFRGSVDGAKAA